jgi:tetratricopeptide (TPR) repeat protein
MLQIGLALLLAAAIALMAGAYGGWLGAVVFGLVTGAIAYLAIGRRVARRLEHITAPVERHLRAGRVERAIAELDRARPLARWQLGLGRAIDGQVGVLIYAHQGDAKRAQPYLARAPRRLWQGHAMLAAIHFRARRYDEMRAVFERALRRNRKVGLLYAAYAYCERARGRSAEAIEILARGRARIPRDEVLRRNHLALQNNKRLQLRGYGADWWALRLEAPPREATQPPQGARLRRRR